MRSGGIGEEEQGGDRQRLDVIGAPLGVSHGVFASGVPQTLLEQAVGREILGVEHGRQTGFGDERQRAQDIVVAVDAEAVELVLPSGRDFLQECLEGDGAFGNGGADLVRVERGGGGVEADVDVGVALGVRAAVGQDGAICRRRNRDRHLQQRRDPTCRRGAGAAGEVLALGVAGGTAVKMGVDHAGEH